MLYLEHGKPMIFGKNRDKGIRLNGLTPQMVDAAGRATPSDLLIHDEKAADPSLAFLLSRMRYPDFPEPLGVFRDVDQPCYDGVVREQIAEAIAERGPGNLDKLLHSGSTWRVS